jgi:hypothetical protein
LLSVAETSTVNGVFTPTQVGCLVNLSVVPVTVMGNAADDMLWGRVVTMLEPCVSVSNPWLLFFMVRLRF